MVMSKTKNRQTETSKTEITAKTVKGKAMGKIDLITIIDLAITTVPKINKVAITKTVIKMVEVLTKIEVDVKILPR